METGREGESGVCRYIRAEIMREGSRQVSVQRCERAGAVAENLGRFKEHVVLR